MIVTLPKPGDERYDRTQQMIRRRPQANRRGQVKIIAAYHAPIAHVLGKPCIYFSPRPRWWRYPLVHERNVIPILVHESVHCAIQRLLGVEGMRVWNQIVDTEFPNVGDL